MNILADENMAQVAAHFSSLGNLRCEPGREIDARSVQDIEVLLVRSVTAVDKELLANSPVKFVGSATSGLEHINRPYLAANDIGFSHAPGSNANSVVEYVLSVIASDGDRLEQLLAGAELGIIGYGIVGQALHARLQALEIACLAYDPWLKAGANTALTSLDAVLSCPVVCLHAELTDRRPWPSRHLLHAENLRALPADGLLINAGRGPLINNADLLNVLLLRPDLRVALDVWEFEPEVDLELMALCTWATPHIAGYSFDGKIRATQMLQESMCRFFNLAIPDHQAQQELIEIRVPEHRSDAELIRWLQAQSYQVQNDHADMCGKLEFGFDRLRKTYSVRHELTSYRVSNADEMSESALATCRAMGLGLGAQFYEAGSR